MTQLFSDVARDIRGGVRVFARHRIAATMAVVSLGLALGITAGLISVVNSWLFPPAGVSEPATLQWMTIAQRAEDGFAGALTYRDFAAVRVHSPDVPAAAFLSGRASVRTSDLLERDDVAVGFVSANFFAVAGAKAAVGRLFDAADARAGGEASIVLSDDAWARMYQRSVDVVGRSIDVGGRSFAIVGVAERGFTGPPATFSPALWLQVEAFGEGNPRVLEAAHPRVLVRLRHPGEVTRFRILAAQAIAAARSAHASGHGEPRVELQPILQPLGADRRASAVVPAVWGLIMALLAVAVVNLAGFLLTIAAGRQREIALRLALGAGRPTVFRQLLTEGLLVGTAAAGFGWLALWLVLPLLDWMIQVPLGAPLRADLRTYRFLFVAAVAASVAGGLAPMRYASRVSIVGDLNRGQGRIRLFSGQTSGRAVLVGLQVSMSVVVLVLAVLWTRGAERARDADLGFDAAHVLFLRGRHIGAGWTAADADRYWRSATERLCAIDGVAGVGLARHLFGGGYETLRLRHESGGVFVVAMNRTNAGYFDAMQVRLVSGRLYTESEVGSGAPVALVSERVARRMWGKPGQAVGASMSRIDRTLGHMTIVGVVEDAVQKDLTDLADPGGAVYLPLPAVEANDAVLVVRVSGDAAAQRHRIERALPVFSPARPPRLSRLEAIVQQQVRLTQIPSRIARLGALCVVVLTIVGLQGLVALAVHQRIKDIAIRVALGANGWRVTSYVAGMALRPALWGLALGVAGSIAVVRVMRAMLFGASALEPVALVVCSLLLCAAAVTGTAGPLFQALRVDPARTLTRE